MTNPFANSPFGSDFGKVFEEAAKKSQEKKRQAGVTDKPLPQIRGKRIGEVLYVRAEDVADALESQAPNECVRLIRKLRGAS